MSIEPKSRLFIKTYGCQMNVYDSRRMADALAPQGFGEVDAPEEADLVILNTCHIREKAAEKVYSELGHLRRLKEKRALTIAVAGCVAQAEGEEMLRRAPAVDLVVGPQAYHRLPDLLARRAAGGRAIVETEFPAEDKFDRLAPPAPGRTLARGVSAFLTVQEGCDKFCSFCVVPYTRGAEFSRPLAQIEAEARAFAQAGVKELTLLGQNVNAWHGEGPDGGSWGLGRLIMHLAGIDGIDRLRYTTSHPRDMDDELIVAHAAVPKLMPYLHLPVQAGSDRILKAMNRGHGAQTYVDLVARIRRGRPDIALSGDFIVGFPGESEEDFAATLALVREVGYAGSFSFKYSPRPGTPAALSAGQVADEVKAERLARLQVLLEEQRLAFNRSCLGRTMTVLLEKPGRRDGQLIGRSPYLQSVHVDAGARRIGDMVDVVISAVGSNSLSAHSAEVPE